MIFGTYIVYESGDDHRAKETTRELLLYSSRHTWQPNVCTLGEIIQ
jgi:hypothetical protein